MTPTGIDKVVDQPIFFPPDEATYFGIVSHPPGVRQKTGVILLAGTQPGCTTIGRNRMWVEVARDLAHRGFPTIRLDYAGLGESLGGSVEYDLNQPAVDVYGGAVAHLAGLGVDKVVAVGTCFGSRTALAAASGHDAVCRVLLLAPPVRNITKGQGGTSHMAMYASPIQLFRKAFKVGTMRRLFSSKHARRNAGRVLSMSAKSRTSRLTAGAGDRAASLTEAAQGFIEPLSKLVERNVPVRIVFGADDYFYTEFLKATEGALGDLIKQADGLIAVHTVPGVIRGFVTVDVQQEVKAEVAAWVEGCG